MAVCTLMLAVCLTTVAAVCSGTFVIESGCVGYELLYLYFCVLASQELQLFLGPDAVSGTFLMASPCVHMSFSAIAASIGVPGREDLQTVACSSSLCLKAIDFVEHVVLRHLEHFRSALSCCIQWAQPGLEHGC